MEAKPYPSGYSPTIQRILRDASFSDGKDVVILGSGSLRSQQYAADVDAYERTEIKGRSKADALSKAARRFQAILRRLLQQPFTYVMDIKCGSIEDWIVIPKDSFVEKGRIHGYDSVTAKAKLRQLQEDGVITEDEYTSAFELLNRKLTPNTFLDVKQELRFNLMRWTPKEILEGKKVYRGREVTLEEAMSQPTIMKLDLVVLVDGVFTEVSIIYELLYKDERINNFPTVDVLRSVRENVLHYWKSNNPFKMAKRMFTIARFTERTKDVDKLIPFFNSDLGRLYAIISDLDTISAMLDTLSIVPIRRIKEEIGNIPSRLANIWTLKDYIEKEPVIFRRIQALLSDDKDTLASRITKITEALQEILTKHAKTELKKIKMYPPPALYLP